jgi:hypothetical protein
MERSKIRAMVLFNCQFLYPTHLFTGFLSCQCSLVTIISSYLETVRDQFLLRLVIENYLFVEYHCKEIEVIRENGYTDLTLYFHDFSHQKMNCFS